MATAKTTTTAEAPKTDEVVALTTEARLAAISKIVGSKVGSHHNKPQGLVRVKAGEYSLEVKKGKTVKSFTIAQAASGAWSVDGQGEYSTRGEAFIAAHSL